MVVIDGKEYNLNKLAAESGVATQLIVYRLRKHPEWPIEMITAKPKPRRNGYIEFDGDYVTNQEAAQMCRTDYESFMDWKRNHKGKCLEDAMAYYNDILKAEKRKVDKLAQKEETEVRRLAWYSRDVYIVCDLFVVDRCAAGYMREKFNGAFA